MNYKQIDFLLNELDKQFDQNWSNEHSKWAELKVFEKRFVRDTIPDDYLSMWKSCFDKKSDLFKGSEYFPLGNAENIIKEDSRGFIDSINTLFDDSLDLQNRINGYIDQITKIGQNIGLFTKEKKNKSCIDARYISVLLFFHDPENFALYKYKEYHDFNINYDIGLSFEGDPVSKIENANIMIDILSEYLVTLDSNVIKKYRSALEKDENLYQDPNLRLFAQNLIWFAIAYPHLEIEDKDKIEIIFNKGKLTKSDYKPSIKTKGKQVDYVAKEKASIKTGYLGEYKVLEFEKQKLEQTKFTPRWVSKIDGDGLGYDILSYDLNGSKIYIEVKTTRGDEYSPFFISATELLAAQKYKKSYFIYRLYKKNNECFIDVYNGLDVIELCNTPYLYIVTADKN